MANTYTLNPWPFYKSLLEACYTNLKILVGTAQTAFYSAMKLEITNRTKDKHNCLYILEHESGRGQCCCQRKMRSHIAIIITSEE